MTNSNTAVFFTGCLLFLCGCGSGLTLQGTVSIDSVPIEKGTISFTPVETGTGEAVAAEIKGGKYLARNIPPGKTRVQFQAQRETGKMVTSIDPAEGSTHPEVVNLIPTNYRKGIEITLMDSDKTQNFDLASH